MDALDRFYCIAIFRFNHVSFPERQNGWHDLDPPCFDTQMVFLKDFLKYIKFYYIPALKKWAIVDLGSPSFCVIVFSSFSKIFVFHLAMYLKGKTCKLSLNGKQLALRLPVTTFFIYSSCFIYSS